MNNLENMSFEELENTNGGSNVFITIGHAIGHAIGYGLANSAPVTDPKQLHMYQ